MQLARHIFETTVGKVLLPWINLGFMGALMMLLSEAVELLRGSSL